MRFMVISFTKCLRSTRDMWKLYFVKLCAYLSLFAFGLFEPPLILQLCQLSVITESQHGYVDIFPAKKHEKRRITLMTEVIQLQM